MDSMTKPMLAALRLLACLALFTFANYSLQAQQTVTGKVLSAEDNTPLPGVTVEVSGAETAVTTGADGSISIRAAYGASLSV